MSYLQSIKMEIWSNQQTNAIHRTCVYCTPAVGKHLNQEQIWIEMDLKGQEFTG